METLCEQRRQLQEENTLVLEEKRERQKEHTAALQHLPILQQSVLIKYSMDHPWEKLQEKDCEYLVEISPLPRPSVKMKRAIYNGGDFSYYKESEKAPRDFFLYPLLLALSK
ncbi:hypothetical protein P5673_024440 [Acropora cervicornis]|uniref:Uncharacterized protein n=1 Tax=Acropora cervicornis TaxID=6130 RepID=A0AAD9Q3Y0_ACRCE|nr:hypothetical protein P5673_024440 [Acropora cervicornis]